MMSEHQLSSLFFPQDVGDFIRYCGGELAFEDEVDVSSDSPQLEGSSDANGETNNDSDLDGTSSDNQESDGVDDIGHGKNDGLQKENGRSNENCNASLGSKPYQHVIATIATSANVSSSNDKHNLALNRSNKLDIYPAVNHSSDGNDNAHSDSENSDPNEPGSTVGHKGVEHVIPAGAAVSREVHVASARAHTQPAGRVGPPDQAQNVLQGPRRDKIGNASGPAPASVFKMCKMYWELAQGLGQVPPGVYAAPAGQAAHEPWFEVLVNALGEKTLVCHDSTGLADQVLSQARGDTSQFVTCLPLGMQASRAQQPGPIKTEGPSQINRNAPARQGWHNPQLRPDCIYVLGGDNGDCALSSVEWLQPSTCASPVPCCVASCTSNCTQSCAPAAAVAEQGRWASMRTERVGCAAVVTAEHIYVLGGEDGKGGSLASVERMSLQTGEWSRFTNLLAGRTHCAAAVLAGDVYVIGGRNGWECLPLVERLMPRTQIWARLADMQFARDGCAATVLSGHLYALGGYNGNTSLASVERFHPDTNKWERVADMQNARFQCAAATLGGHIYAIGGCDQGGNCLASVERFDPRTNRWELVAPLTKRRRACAAVAASGILYVLGGRQGSERWDSVECYDQASNRWTVVGRLERKRNACAAVAVKSGAQSIDPSALPAAVTSSPEQRVLSTQPAQSASTIPRQTTRRKSMGSNGPPPCPPPEHLVRGANSRHQQRRASTGDIGRSAFQPEGLGRPDLHLHQGKRNCCGAEMAGRVCGSQNMSCQHAQQQLQSWAQQQAQQPEQPAGVTRAAAEVAGSVCSGMPVSLTRPSCSTQQQLQPAPQQPLLQAQPRLRAQTAQCFTTPATIAGHANLAAATEPAGSCSNSSNNSSCSEATGLVHASESDASNGQVLRSEVRKPFAPPLPSSPMPAPPSEAYHRRRRASLPNMSLAAAEAMRTQCTQRSHPSAAAEATRTQRTQRSNSVVVSSPGHPGFFAESRSGGPPPTSPPLFGSQSDASPTRPGTPGGFFPAPPGVMGLAMKARFDNGGRASPQPWNGLGLLTGGVLSSPPKSPGTAHAQQAPRAHPRLSPPSPRSARAYAPSSKNSGSSSRRACRSIIKYLDRSAR
eukprot:g68600.t1